MLNLSDITGYYIEHSFTDAQKLLLLNGFTILESFNFDGGFYEDKYVNLISSEDTASDSKHLSFMMNMTQDLANVVEQHGIVISKDIPFDLASLVEVTHGLILLANLEDYSEVAYRVNGTSDNRTILVDLLERYSTLSKCKLMESIESVGDQLIESIRDLSKDALNEESNTVDVKHKSYLDKFFKFTEQTPCLGLTLYQKGYSTSLTFDELINILPYSLTSYVEKESITNLPQVALDVLSLLTLTRDDYDKPIFKLKLMSGLVSSDLQLIGRISAVILKIMNDFSMFLEVSKQEERANGN